MTEQDYDEWLLKLRRKVAAQSIVFLQIGASNEPLRRSVLASNFNIVSLDQYFEEKYSTKDSRIFVINDTEKLAKPAISNRLGELRSRIFNDIENEEKKFILLSRYPRIAFPDVVGSSLLEDASFFHAPNERLEGIKYWPTCVLDEKNESEVLVDAIRELGLELCSSLDRIAYEHKLTSSDAIELLNSREGEALDGAGITAIEKGVRVWNASSYLNEIKGALDVVLAEAVEPQQQFSTVSVDLWKIERMIRQSIRHKAIVEWKDGWKRKCLHGDLEEKVLQRACESAYIKASSLLQIRDPLEWLSLGELLEIRKRKEIGDLGISVNHWTAFARDIMPIRNRLAHFRHLRPEDATNAIKWRSLMSEKLNLS